MKALTYNSLALSSTKKRVARSIVWAVLLLAALLAVFAPARAQTATVPIEIRGSHIFVQVEINGKPATLLVDTGAGSEVITPQAAKRLGLKIQKNEEETLIVGAGAEISGTSTVKVDEISIGGVVFKDDQADVLDFPTLLGCDGMLGTSILGIYVTTIDYQNKTLQLTAHQNFEASEAGTVLPLHFYHRNPFVKLHVGDYEGYFLMDTGSNSAVAFYIPFANKNNLRDVYKPALTIITGYGIGGLVKGDLVRLPNVSLGNFEFKNVEGELSHQTEGLFADDFVQGLIGGEIWQRFTLTLDYKHSKAYIKPNALFDKPFDAPRSGLAIFDEGSVVDVAPNTPAQEAGIVVGDKVTAIDGKPIAGFSVWDISDAMRRPAGTQIRLNLRSANGVEREVIMVLRDLI